MNKRVSVFILLIVGFLCFLFYVAQVKTNKLNKEIVANQNSLENYMHKAYGILYNEFEITANGNYTMTNMRGYHGNFRYSWIRAYEIRALFMEKPFEVWIDNRTHEIFGDNFYEVLSTDPKFQHLYSEWVKKQVGIEDENVELKFAGNFDKPYIEFNKIASLSDDYREIFENTHNLYAWLCEVRNIKDLNEDNKLEIAKSVREKYLLKAITITNMSTKNNYGGRIYISSSENARDKDNGYIFDFNIINVNDNNSEMIERK